MKQLQAQIIGGTVWRRIGAYLTENAVQDHPSPAKNAPASDVVATKREKAKEATSGYEVKKGLRPRNFQKEKTR